MSTKRKKILFVTTSYPRFSGDIAGCFFLPLINELKKNYDITILTPDDEFATTKKPEIKRFKYFFSNKWQKLTYKEGMPENLSSKPLNYIQIPFLLISLIYNTYKLSKSNDIIITNWIVPGGLAGAIVSMITKKPHINIAHSAGVHFISNFIAGKKLLLFILKNTIKTIFVSPFLVEKLTPILPEKYSNYEIIPMGITIEEYDTEINRQKTLEKYSIPINHNKILFMGRLIKIKGLNLLISSLNNLDNTTLIVAGDGPEKEYYKNLSNKKGLNTKFIGFIEGKEKIDLLKSVDIVVIPSIEIENKRCEGSPVIIMEAMAAGKIIIASNTGGISHMIEDNVNGKLFSPANTNELNQILTEVIANKDFYYKLAKEAKFSACKYDVKIISNKYFEIIEKVT